jgi:polyisoprenoid-binding protein YceI
MKAIRVLLITVWAIALQFNTVEAQVFSVKSYKLTVSGTSSLHDWESTVDNLEVKGAFTADKGALTDVRDVVVKIPVKAIKSTKGKIMDNKTWEAFDYEKNPTITFVLTSKTINASKNTLTVSGKLSMAGVTHNIDLDLAYKLLPGGNLQVTGSRRLTMSDYKMEPPTAMMGAIKVGDEIVVTFDLTLTHNNSTL